MKKYFPHILWISFFIFLFIILLFINFLTPMIGEDFAFIQYEDTKYDLAQNIIHGFFYRFYPDNSTFNLRLGDTLSFLWLNLGILFGVGKSLFSFLNVIITILFFLLLFYWGYCRFPDFTSINDLIIFSLFPVLFLICSLCIGDIFFWCTGAANYLWTAVILLGTAVPYRKYLNNENYKMRAIFIPVYMVFSYIAAFTNENSVPIIILLGVFLLLRDILKKGVKNVSFWLFASLLSMGIGYLVLVFSPNTKRRSLVYREMFSLPENMSIQEIINNGNRVIRLFIKSNYIFLLLFFICLLALIYFLLYRKEIKTFFLNQKLLLENTFLLLLSSISILALFFAPYTEIRTFLFVQIFLVVLIINIYHIFLNYFCNGLSKYLKYIPYVCACFLSVFFLFRLLDYTIDYSLFVKKRTLSIERQLAEGKDPVIAELYHIENNKYLNTREKGYISSSQHFDIRLYAKYHGANEIIWSLYSYEKLTGDKN